MAEYGDVRDDIGLEVTWQRADVLWSLLADRLTPEQAELVGKGLYEPMLQGLLQLRPAPILEKGNVTMADDKTTTTTETTKPEPPPEPDTTTTTTTTEPADEDDKDEDA